MLRYVYGHQLSQFPRLAESMFRDRADQFGRRLGWEVSVDDQGFERDAYDDANPLYVIWELPDGTHGGSMRFLPTTGPTMVNDHFLDLTDGVRIESPFIWECTRFCVSPRADRKTAAGLVLGAGELMAHFEIQHYCGVFDPRMERIYRLYGVEPDIIGEAGEGADKIAVGLWAMRSDAWEPVLRRLGISRAVSKDWIDRSFRSAGHPALAMSA